MRNADIGYTIMAYNFVVCVLLMLASEKIGHYAGTPFGRYRAKAARYTQLSVFTFGATWALLMGGLFITFMIMIYFSN